MDLFEELQDLMIKYHFRPSKKLSQFYCTNEALLRFLTNNAKINSKDIVLEIGPGTGFLTKFLLEKGKVVAIEKDEIMIELLEKKFEKEIKSGKLKLIEGDAMFADYDMLGITKVVSLPPYHLSSELMMKITLSKNIKKAVIVFDTGFVEKLTAFEGMREYNALTVLVNLNANVEVLETIDKASFYPQPNCQSVVVLIDYDRVQDSEKFYLFLKEIFRHKNKDLIRSLKQSQPNLEENKLIKKNNFEKLEHISKKVYSLTVDELHETFQDLN